LGHLPGGAEYALPADRVVGIDGSTGEKLSKNLFNAPGTPEPAARLNAGLELSQVRGFLLGAAELLLLIPHRLFRIFRPRADQRPAKYTTGESGRRIEKRRQQRLVLL